MYFLPKYRRGIKNKYRKGMPVFEMITKDLGYVFTGSLNFLKNGFKEKTIVAFPHYPSRGATLYKIAKHLNYNLTNRLDANAEATVFWEYLTFRQEFGPLDEKAAQGLKVINLNSRDISKLYVDEAFTSVFGYGTRIDPTTFQGKYVQKNDTNALHDGKVLTQPLKQAEPGFIYQILINNQHNDTQVEDIRVPIVKEVVPFVYLKYRDINERFKNTTVKTLVVPTEKVFNPEEIAKINAFCQKVNLEFGELDVLRNKDDGKIYIVDVNNTPQGPPANTSKADQEYAISVLAKQFSKAFLKS
ncbi:hypothetical protein I5M27_05655 [Adhaeribacter sp. BT258]|uniref:ATP-grasp domain-containing protein n=1 Tax=Adhaeribacter terrigena TaxID=2793070 RepID=A0ABS1BZ88_9BACT|nr:hypothetical protein [Adhaeribacter terrigena]MBK0402461.1 hypothetical protein [Adhaeribacter terrigena]